MIGKPYILSDVEILDPNEKHYEHWTLIARPCVIQRLETGERMIISFDVGSLRTSTVKQIETVDNNVQVTTMNNRYIFTPCVAS